MKKLILLILLLALFLRIFRLADFTEFYGDQGLDGMLVLNAVDTKTIPLVGPPSSQGLNQGAFYLYLVAPAMLVTNFNPLGPAYLMALLGTFEVFTFYLLARKIFLEKAALISTLLFALSPIAVFMSRTYWNSFLLPVGTTVVLYCLTLVQEKKDTKFFVLFGLVLGFFVQMHYTGLLLIAMSVLFWIFMGLWKFKKYTFFAVIAFTFTFIPFILYQLQHQLIDIIGIAKIVYPFSHIYRNVAPPNIPTLFSMIFQDILPQVPILVTGVAGLVLLLIPFASKKTGFWYKMLVAWLLIGIILVSRNRSDFQLHYLDILLPIPFLLFGAVLDALQKNKMTMILTGVTIPIVLCNIVHLDTFAHSQNRLAKTEALTNSMIVDSANNPFSFTIISPSFSDTHYRFLFRKAHVTPVAITDNSYQTLFIACEKTDCPNAQTLANEKSFQVTCYDLHCAIFYPRIDLTMWHLREEKNIEGGVLFRFERFTNQKNAHS